MAKWPSWYLFWTPRIRALLSHIFHDLDCMPPSWRFHLASELPGISSHIEGVNCAESPDMITMFLPNTMMTLLWRFSASKSILGRAVWRKAEFSILCPPTPTSLRSQCRWLLHLVGKLALQICTLLFPRISISTYNRTSSISVILTTSPASHITWLSQWFSQ